jgi:hypothetical protein
MHQSPQGRENQFPHRIDQPERQMDLAEGRRPGNPADQHREQPVSPV